MIWACTFGNVPKWSGALDRLQHQLKDCNLFDKICIYTQHNVPQEYLQKHQTFIDTNQRGFGYYFWKPMILLMTLQQMQQGDLLLYVDAGCHVRKEGMVRLKEYINLTHQHDLLTFSIDHPEYKWTKSDLLQRFSEVDPYSKQVISGIHMWKKNDQTVMLAKSWFDLMQCYQNIDDSKSLYHPEHPKFQEHRHDQSCFSLLVKSLQIGLILPDESWWPGSWESNSHFPIHALRDRN